MATDTEKLARKLSETLKKHYGDDEKVKNCPFCGSDNLRVTAPRSNPAHESWVTCKTCHSHSGESHSEELAIKNWNTRAAT